MDFEYAIRKDIRNNPIVREVDEARQRQLWRSAGIGVVLVLVLLFSAWQHFEVLRHGMAMARVQQERAAEIQTLRSPERIERVATKQLHLVAPTRNQAIVIERVIPAAAPDKSIVAAR
jgi:hypothetical protein